MSGIPSRLKTRGGARVRVVEHGVDSAGAGRQRVHLRHLNLVVRGKRNLDVAAIGDRKFPSLPERIDHLAHGRIDARLLQVRSQRA